MGTISSSTGLMSGLDIESIVSQLMQIEARPRNLIETRIETVTKQQTALMGLQARLLTLQATAASFNDKKVFEQKTVASSNEDVLTATADRWAAAGSYQFRVKQLATAHHLVSRGYASLDSSLGQGAVAIEIGNGQLLRPTELSSINGQDGFTRGKIQITDRAGNVASVDLSAAATVEDILSAINEAQGVSVYASVSGDSIIIQDLSGGAGTLGVSGQAAQSLGIAGTADPGDPSRIIGQDIVYLTEDTRISQLNDGNGMRGLEFGDDLLFQVDGIDLFQIDLRDVMYKVTGDSDSATTLAALNGGQGVRLGAFRITDQNGNSVDVDLTELAARPDMQDKPVTLAHVEDFIQEKITEKNQDLSPENQMSISIVFGASDHLTITDNSEPVGTQKDPITGETTRQSTFIIEDLKGGFAAADLGITDEVSGKNIHGEKIWRMETLGDVVNAINNHWDNYDSSLPGGDKGLVSVSLNDAGDGLQIAYNAAGTFSIGDTQAADDLGIVNAGFAGSFEGRRLIAGLNTILLRSLNGGSAGGDNRITEGGSLDITDRAGNTATVDLSDAQTLQDVLDAINDSSYGLNVTATINENGTGLKLVDTTAAGSITGNLVIADSVGSSLAQKLNLATDVASSQLDTGNLQLQYVSEATRLEDLRQGRGIRLGSIKVTDSDGATKTLDLSSAETLADIIDEFTNSGTNIRARINDTGDGLLLYDELSTADSPIVVQEVDNGYTAHDLNLLGVAQQDGDGDYYIDGSYEYRFTVGGGDTIEDFATRVNKADIGVTVAVLNDGSQNSPYRLSFTSEITGRRGSVYLDAGDTNLTTRTLSEAQDAVMLFGDGDESNSLVITSSSNTLENIVNGVTIELHAVSDEPVQLDIQQDLDSITAQISSFVDAFNKAMKEIDSLSQFNPDTLERGVLFSDRSVNQIRDALSGLVARLVPGMTGKYRNLSSIGVSLAPIVFQSGANEKGEQNNYAVVSTPQLEFNEEAFRAAFAEDPEAVTQLFTQENTGLGDYIDQRLEDLAGSSDSAIKSRLDAMNNQREMFNDRMESLNELLARKETRLYNQFYAMEQALASMQNQQSSLTTLASMASSMKSK